MHVLLFIFTVGIGNFIYAAVKYSARDQVLVKVDPTPVAG
jgi:hypothetical protein